jgi:hypothetical protein
MAASFSSVASAACKINVPCGFSPPKPPVVPKPTNPNVDAIRFAWSQPQLTGDGNGGVAEINYDVNAEASTVPVRLNACGSTATTQITSYRFSFDDGSAPIASTNCTVIWSRRTSPTFRSVNVTITVYKSDGSSFSTTRVIRYRDLVIASLGDSAASGEGTQDNGYAASPNCDRSGLAATALAALQVQRDVGSATVVHFWHLACSGATISAAGTGPFVDRKSDPNDPYPSGGLLDPYSGARHMQKGGASPPLPPQMDRLQTLIGQSQLPVARLLIQAGANDGGWATVLKDCLTVGGEAWLTLGPLTGDLVANSNENACLTGWTPPVNTAMSNLWGPQNSHFNALHNRVIKLMADKPGMLEPQNIFLTQYYDPLDSLSNQPVLCAAEPFAELVLRQWGVNRVEKRLQADVSAAATAYKWGFIGGVQKAFQGHGVCHTNSRWVNSWYDSEFVYKHENGTWHPNADGQHAMGNIIYTAIKPGLE